MNQTNLNEVVSWILSDAANAVKSGGQFVLEQAPDVARQFIAYHTIRNWLGVVGGLVGLWLLYSVGKVLAKAVDEDMDKYMPKIIGCGFVGLLLVFEALTCIEPALKVTLAPKVFLLESAVAIAKGRSL